jgi:TPR repeat protein
MLGDPILRFASSRETIDPALVDICLADKTKWNAAAAKQACEIVQVAARAGSAFARCMCFGFSLAGLGQVKSNDSAFQWATGAADVGFPPGNFLLGKCHEEGIGVPIDLERARQYYELAADGGFGFAACHLAALFHSGRLGNANRLRALDYAALAYQLNDPMAPLLLGGWYEEGDSVIRNENEAVLWYTRAAELGNFFACDRLSRAYALGELGLPKDMELAKKYESMFDSQLSPER